MSNTNNIDYSLESRINKKNKNKKYEFLKQKSTHFYTIEWIKMDVNEIQKKIEDFKKTDIEIVEEMIKNIEEFGTIAQQNYYIDDQQIVDPLSEKYLNLLEKRIKRLKYKKFDVIKYEDKLLIFKKKDLIDTIDMIIQKIKMKEKDYQSEYCIDFLKTLIDDARKLKIWYSILEKYEREIPDLEKIAAKNDLEIIINDMEKWLNSEDLLDIISDKYEYAVEKWVDMGWLIDRINKIKVVDIK